MDNEIYGYIGAFFLSISFIPQVIKSFRLGDFENLSVSFIAFNLISSGFLLAYSVLNFYLPIIIANSVIILCNLCLLFGFFYYKKNQTIKNDMELHYRV